MDRGTGQHSVELITLAPEGVQVVALSPTVVDVEVARAQATPPPTATPTSAPTSTPTPTPTPTLVITGTVQVTGTEAITGTTGPVGITITVTPTGTVPASGHIRATPMASVPTMLAQRSVQHPLSRQPAHEQFVARPAPDDDVRRYRTANHVCVASVPC